MAILTPSVLASAVFATTAVKGATTSLPVNPGSLVAYCLYNFFDGSVTSLTDSANNTYTAAVTSGAVSSAVSQIFFSNIPTTLASGGTFTITISTTAFVVAVSAINGAVGGLDKTASTTSSSTTSISISSGTLSRQQEIVLCCLNTVGTAGTFTEGAGFTTLVNNETNNASVASYKIVNSVASVTWAPSWTTARPVAGVMATFQSTPFLLQSLGVGI